jgi:hypothetical protein
MLIDGLESLTLHVHLGDQSVINFQGNPAAATAIWIMQTAYDQTGREDDVKVTSLEPARVPD